METKGIIRRLDDLGRIVVPKEYRRMLKIELGDPLEIFTLSNGDIVLRRFDMSAAVKNEGELAAAALNEADSEEHEAVTADKVISSVCSFYKLDKEKIDEELSEEFYNNMIGELEFEYTNLNTYANSDWILDNFCISDLDNFKFGKVDQGARIKICDLLNRNWEIGDFIPKIKKKVIMYFLLPDEDTDYYFELEDATIEEI